MFAVVVGPTEEALKEGCLDVPVVVLVVFVLDLVDAEVLFLVVLLLLHEFPPTLLLPPVKGLLDSLSLFIVAVLVLVVEFLVLAWVVDCFLGEGGQSLLSRKSSFSSWSPQFLFG